MTKPHSCMSSMEKIACTIGGMVTTFYSQMVQIFLLFFYVDIMKLSPVFVSVLFLVVRLSGAFISPMFGILVDRIILPWGKYKPWIIIFAIPIGLTGFLTFTPVNLEPIAGMMYATVTYFLFGAFMAMQTAAVSGLGPAVTKNVYDRMSIGNQSFVWIMAGAIMVSAGGQPIYRLLGGGNDGMGMSRLMGIAAIISLLVALFQMIYIKERYVPEYTLNQKQATLSILLGAVLKNKTAIIIYVNNFATNLSHGVRSSVTILFMKHYFRNEALMIPFGLSGMVGTLMGILLSSAFTKKVGLRFNLALSIIMQVLMTALIVVVPADNYGVMIFLVCIVLSSFFMGLSTPAQATMMPAAMDYTELTTGYNLNSFMGSISSFVGNVSIALSGSIAAAALVMIGYVPNIAQSVETLQGLRLLMSVLPAALLLPSICLLWFDLSEEKQHEMGNEIIRRHESREGT